jgi:hypothetical protein
MREMHSLEQNKGKFPQIYIWKLYVILCNMISCKQFICILQCPPAAFIFKLSLSLQRNAELCEFTFYCDQNNNSLAA